MYINDFLELGFVINYESTTPSREWTRVLEDDPVYKKVFTFCKTCKDDYKEIDAFINSLNTSEVQYSLASRSYSNGELIRIRLDNATLRMKVYVIEKDGIILRLVVDKDTNRVYTIDDCLRGFHSVSSHWNVWYRQTIDDPTTLESVFATLHRHRMSNSQDIRNYYNKEIKELKRHYAIDLEDSKVGLKFLAQYKEN